MPNMPAPLIPSAAATAGSSCSGARVQTSEALEKPDAPPAVDNDTPYAFGDFTWLNGSPRNKDTVLDTKILYARNPLRYPLHGGFQPAARSHNRRRHRIVPFPAKFKLSKPASVAISTGRAFGAEFFS